MIQKFIIVHPYNDDVDVEYYNGICTAYRSLLASQARGHEMRDNKAVVALIEEHEKLIQEFQNEHAEYFI